MIRSRVFGAVMAAVAIAGSGSQAQQSASPPTGQAAPAPAPERKADANGNPIRVAVKTGHVSNYDESKVAPYTLPDPLKTVDGKPVRDARDWAARRAEILRLYETQIYGRIPAHTPRVTWKVVESGTEAREGVALVKSVRGRVGEGETAPELKVDIYTPAKVKTAIPVILLVNFGGGGKPPVPTQPPVADEILARGWGYAIVGYNDIQPDRADTSNQGVIGRTLAAGQTQPAADEWGTISAWAWGISRIIDYVETDKAIDAKRIAVFGHSRLGKTVLWASALDPRIAVTFSSCAGEMGSALARRDWGETVDDMAQNFPWQFAANFQKWVGRWNDMPVDAHMLIALSAPRPVFVTGGTTDQWADPVGEFLSLVAAGPVYRLLGKKDVGTTTVPALDTPLTTGDLGYHYHSGGHTATPADWQAFIEFAAKYF